MIAPARIRNFCIIAHIDHGKSTLADRMLELTGQVDQRQMREQLLDSLDLEREHGITIKATPVTMHWTTGREQFQLNLIDTPGHVDFAYEVSRAMAACEGALLLVDASQGIEAQTIANLYQALELGLEIIPVINKIDMPAAQPQAAREAIVELMGVEPDDILAVSAKHGTGVRELLGQVIARVPPPDGIAESPPRALVFDSNYDRHRGVLTHVRVVDGRLAAGDRIHLPGSGNRFEIVEVGTFAPQMQAAESLNSGQVGYVATGLKGGFEFVVGDTLLAAGAPDSQPLPGYAPPRPMVFAGIYPQDPGDYPALRRALDLLRLNDSSLTFEPEESGALGFGFRVGFLGLLHLNIVRERLERDNDLTLIVTNPGVQFRVLTRSGRRVLVDGPGAMPESNRIAEVTEPWVELSIVTPGSYLGPLMELVRLARGSVDKVETIDAGRVLMTAQAPLSEILVDFYDRLKSSTRGYASLDYHVVDFRPVEVQVVDILVNGVRVDALSSILHRQRARRDALEILSRLRKVIPRQLFQVALQASVGGKVIARETIPALRKDVLAKCYGGDVTRKRKLLKKQAEGKKRMKMVGQVEIPQAAFTTVLER
ncbi:MAG: translation elongation factor 4 [Chloroflexota bacterium]|nr:translation elongation factor 4 [Chloroflexota bacterium]MXW27678.1 elongation factor 4 [Chloroflexota bacterium]MXY12566.1 elongation factor 4 [Chloroflexota bacterium]MYB16578.1 elongation factor 4 [Chloroflexota bacterium]MYC48000.1 elongation factor 4 [Chloroflexota bacterium]